MSCKAFYSEFEITFSTSLVPSVVGHVALENGGMWEMQPIVKVHSVEVSDTYESVDLDTEEELDQMDLIRFVIDNVTNPDRWVFSLIDINLSDQICYNSL